MALKYIGYQGPHHNVQAPNLPSTSAYPEMIDKYLKKECSSGRMAGPFPQPPFQPFHCSGLGVVQKQDSTWWVMTHLSAPDSLKIFDIDQESITLSYTTVDDTVGIYQQLKRGSLLAKIDLKKAFKQCPIRQEDWHLLGLHWRGTFSSYSNQAVKKLVENCLSLLPNSSAAALKGDPVAFCSLLIFRSCTDLLFRH